MATADDIAKEIADKVKLFAEYNYYDKIYSGEGSLYEDMQIMLNMSAREANAVLKGKPEMKLKDIVAMADFFNISVGYLMRNTAFEDLGEY